MPAFRPFFSVRRSQGIIRCLVLAGALAAGCAHAQDSTLTSLMHQHRLPLTQVAGPQFAGPGWDELRQDVQRSQFVLVGEDQGTAQIPAFTTALACPGYRENWPRPVPT